ncbi:MAG: hypothetical protein GZ089_05170 [Aromatoleum sp.]|nr:hypothetical protein [Aromatoleum sp.]
MNARRPDVVLHSYRGAMRCVLAGALALAASAPGSAQERTASAPPQDVTSLLKSVNRSEGGTLTASEAGTLTPAALEQYRRLRAAPYVGKQMRVVHIDMAEVDRIFLKVGPPGERISLRLFADTPIVLSPRFRELLNRREESAKAGGRAWLGTAEVPGKGAPAASASLYWGDNYLYGTFEILGTPLRIVPLGDGFHAIYVVDARGLPREHPAKPRVAVKATSAERPNATRIPPVPPPKAGPGAGRPPAGPARAADGTLVEFSADDPPPLPGRPASLLPAGNVVREAGTGAVVITVAVAFTDEAAKLELQRLNKPDSEEPSVLMNFAQKELDRVNQAFLRSGIKVKLVPVKAARVGIKEPSAQALADRHYTNGFDDYQWSLTPASLPNADGLHCWWGKAPAANVLLLFGRFGDNPPAGTPISGYCGVTARPTGTVVEGPNPDDNPTIASLLDEAGPGFAPGTFGYSVVRMSCTELLSTVHEIGHLFGADHERPRDVGPPIRYKAPGKNGQSVTTSFGFGTQIQSAPNTALTVMAMGTGDAGREHRQPVYSTATTPPPPMLLPPPAPGAQPLKWGTRTADNARLINMMAPYFSRHVPPSCNPVP